VLQVQDALLQVDADPIERLREYQAIGPVDEVAAALEDQVEVALAGPEQVGAVRRVVPAQVEAVIGAVEVGIDRLVAAPIEAVAGVEVLVTEASAQEHLLRAVEIQPQVGEKVRFPQPVVVVLVVVEAEVVELEVSAVIDQCALAG